MYLWVYSGCLDIHTFTCVVCVCACGCVSNLLQFKLDLKWENAKVALHWRVTVSLNIILHLLFVAACAMMFNTFSPFSIKFLNPKGIYQTGCQPHLTHADTSLPTHATNKNVWPAIRPNSQTTNQPASQP